MYQEALHDRQVQVTPPLEAPAVRPKEKPRRRIIEPDLNTTPVALREIERDRMRENTSVRLDDPHEIERLAVPPRQRIPVMRNTETHAVRRLFSDDAPEQEQIPNPVNARPNRQKRVPKRLDDTEYYFPRRPGRGGNQ